MGRILALDFGIKRVGVAVTDPLQIIASPYDTVKTTEIWTFLSVYFKKEQVERLVIGMPVNLNLDETHATSLVKEFIINFKKKYPEIPVSEVDERFTSKLAKQTMIDGGLKKSKRSDKNMVDKISASLILQTYLGI